MMGQSVFAEINELLTGEIRALTALHHTFLQGTGPKDTVAANHRYYLRRETTLTGKILCLYLLPLLHREYLGYLIQ